MEEMVQGCDEKQQLAKQNEYCRKIEKSLRKRFRKSIWSQFTKALHDYELIQDGDRIAVCVSGDMASMLLAKLFQELYLHGKRNFELEFIAGDMGCQEQNRNQLMENAKLLEIPLTIAAVDDAAFLLKAGETPYEYFADMRRDYLYEKARELGCNKIALGTHFDDVIETILAGMIYDGKIETLMPKQCSKRFDGMELIRPLYLVKEEPIKAWQDSHGLQFAKWAADGFPMQETRRNEIKKLAAQLRQRSEFVDKNIFNSVRNVNLKTIIGYKKDGNSHNFLEKYEQEI